MKAEGIKLDKDQPVRSYQKVVDKIKEVIIEGKLSPGDRLKSERELAEKLKVSRTVIREALKSLEMLGIVEVRARGTYIRAPEIKQVLETFSYSLALDQITVQELVETRKIIEIQAAKLAAVRRTSEDLAILVEILKEMKNALQENHFEKSVEADFRFHYYLVKASHNQVLTRFMETISDLYQQVLAVTRKELGKFNGMDEGIYGQHLDIFYAIKNGDVNLAEKSVVIHLDSLEEELKQIEQGLEVTPPRYAGVTEVELD
ncbi:FadR/GntR family transcriptional regulator [Brevibacillus sp. B_LB10_24]|uniref:FadR/GntR family transcriptional regulator n=1 Tax=Brevibacillus sp. B_LB10_24 TaxID=3380645 RepID=UPI0038BBED6B